jgi:hypothetical protein
MLQLLDVFRRYRIELFAAEERHEMHVKNRALRRDAARLLSVRPRVTIEESRGELFQRGHLPFYLRRAVKQQVPFVLFAPALRRCFR